MLDKWKPISKPQEQFLALPDTIREAFFGGSAGPGKAIDINEFIQTASGMRQMLDIHTGDIVFAPDGNPVQVLGESEIFTDHDCYKIYFDSGFTIIADAGHLWNVIDLFKNDSRMLNTRDLFQTKNKRGRHQFAIEVSKSYTGSELDHLIKPYTLGVWLGDGCQHDPKITCHHDDLEIIKNIIADGYEVHSYDYGYSHYIQNFKWCLKALKLLQNKHIPEEYYNSSIENRLNLLRGLMDSDGTCDKAGQCELSISDYRLGNDAVRLIRSLGIKAQINEKASYLNGVKHKNRFRITFTTETLVFKLSTKRVRQFKAKHRPTNVRHYITKIEKVESIPVKCIQVEGSRYQVSDKFVATHNSECLMMYPIVREFHEQRRFKALFTRRTYGELKAEIIPRSRELYSSFGGKFNKADLIWEFESGALIFFGHIEHEDDVHKYDSMEINLFLPDEIQTLTEYMYTYIAFTRVRSSITGLPAIIRGAGMPGNIGHSWVKKRFIDPAPKGGVKIIGKGGNKRIFIFSTLADNTKIDPEYAKALDALPDEAERRAKKFGDWNAYEGQVFDEFRERHYAGEPENALHIIEPFEIPTWWPRIVCIDWGFRAWNYVLYGAISPTKRVYIYREQAWKGQKIEEWAPYVREFIDRENVKIIKICKSASSDMGQEHTIQEQIEAALGRPVDLARNNSGTRVAGKQLLHEYLRWKPKHIPPKEHVKYDEEVALWTMRNHGENAYKNYLTQFAAIEAEGNIPKLQIFNRSPEDIPISLLPSAIKMCMYAKNKEDRKAEDVAQFDGDDPYDNIRYLIDGVDRYFMEAESEFRGVQARQRLVEDFEKTKDWNRLFRQAHAIDEMNESIYQPARRYRH